ncbi:DNA helicase II / ATP-dependent DNA helicase PcrA [Candidatus Magnetomoraceae bacterium gMMP-15]
MKYTIDYKKMLNSAQYDAVTSQKGPVLVIAGAGSGKTRTLTYRVARLVEDGVPPESILLLTFTRKASQEMLQRAIELVDKRCSNITGGTFHSFASLMLRRYASRIDFVPNFVILDRIDSEDIIDSLRSEKGLNTRDRRFPRKSTIASIFSKAINKSVDIKAILSKEYPQFMCEHDILIDINTAYKKYKSRYFFMDYDDLLVFFLKVLKENSDVVEKLSSQYQYIMVDEYQDTNLIQAEIIYLLGKSHRNVMVVGDDSQSIYGFRGAYFKNIIEFPNVFPNTNIIRLEENYRSTQPILNLANEIIDQASEKFTKTLFTRKKEGSLPLMLEVSNENTQSRLIVEEIQRLNEKNVPLREIAVLFRAGYHAFDLELELNGAKIPFVKFGGFKFMEKAHIKDLIAHIRILISPYDKTSWIRVLTLLKGIGPKTAEKIYNFITEKEKGYKAIFDIKTKASYGKSLNQLRAVLEEIDIESMSVVEIGDKFIEYYSTFLQYKYDDYPRRIKDLERFTEIMIKYESLDAFLADMALEPPANSVSDVLYPGQINENNDLLVLSTIHSAKGLEWNTVFVIWVLEGRFPPFYAMDSRENMEEELRLMYVAATRAKKNLYFICPVDVYDQFRDSFLDTPSPFLRNIPDDVLAWRYFR